MSTSFTTHLKSNLPRVYRTAIGFLGNRELAKEAAQESLMKAYAARERYDTTQPFYPWLYRITKNTCLDILAKKRRRPQAHVDLEAFASCEPSPLMTTQRRQEDDKLWNAINQLDDTHREIINMRHFQDLSYDEIGEILNVATGTVMSRLYRARKALSKKLKELS